MIQPAARNARGANDPAMLIVDANNVFHAAGDGRAPDAVVRLLESVINSRYASGGVVLVCDGSPGRLSPAGQAELVRLMAGRAGNDCRVVYAGPEREADDVIEHMIAAAVHAPRILVVSSDARLTRAAFRAGAPSLGAREFLAHLDKDRTKAAGRAAAPAESLDPASVAWWMRYFGYAPETPGLARPVPRPSRATPRAKPDESPAPARAPVRIGKQAAPSDWLADAMRMWPGLFHPEELDMEQWLPEKKRRRRK